MPSSRGSSVGSSDPRSRSPKSWRAKGGKHWEDDTFKFNVESKGGSGRGGEKSEKDTLGWISRTVCGFGRYPDKRPKGLNVDGAGAFSVRNLMQVWGTQHKLSERQIVTAIQQNMFHERKSGSEGAPELRFAIDQGTNGDVRIRVNPSRRQGQKGSRPPATPFRGGRGERRGRSFDNGFSGEEEDFLDRGSRGRGGNNARNNSRNGSRNSSHNGRKHFERERRPSSRDPWVGAGDPWASSRGAGDPWASSRRPQPPQGRDKVSLPMPVHQPAQAAGACLHAHCQLRAHSSGEHGGFCCQRCQWAHGSGGPPQHGKKCEGLQGAEERDADMDGDGDNCPAKIVKWIEWVLDVGYIEYDICKEDLQGTGRAQDQWLSVNDLLTQLQDRQPKFGVHSVNRLRQVFADYGREFEFTEDNKWLRKVDSEERKDPPSESPNPFAPKATVPAEVPPVVEPPTFVPVLAKVELRDDEKMDAPPRPADCPPPPPQRGQGGPGTNWQRFEDGGHYWWYYKGPCGEWWCTDDGEFKVQRYSEQLMEADRH